MLYICIHGDLYIEAFVGRALSDILGFVAPGVLHERKKRTEILGFRERQRTDYEELSVYN